MSEMVMKQSQRIWTVRLLAAMFFSAGAVSLLAAVEASAGDRIYKHVGPDGRITYSSEPGGKEFNAPRKGPSGASQYRATPSATSSQTPGTTGPRVTAASQPRDESPNKGRAGGSAGGGGAPGGGGGGGGGGGLSGSTNSASNTAASTGGPSSSAGSTSASGGNGASGAVGAGAGSTGAATGAAAPSATSSGGAPATGGSAPGGTTSSGAATSSSGSTATSGGATRTAAAESPAPPPPPPPPPQPPALPRSITANSDYLIGTYYFPGWKDNEPGAPAKLPWERIKAYPEREPLLGWYKEGEVEVIQQQLRWMYDYGIDFVVFDWYWGGGNTFLEHALRAYLNTPTNSLVPFMLLWANHTEVPRNLQEYDAMVDFWISRYFSLPQYMRFAGMPAVVVFSHPNLQKQAAQMKVSTAELLNRAISRAKSRGLPGIFFIGGSHVDPSIVNRDSIISGYSAFSAYNYHGRAGRDSESYAQLDDDYQRIWRWFVDTSPIPYLLPMTSGWDKRPWGGSKNPLHDNSFSDPDGFERHLVAAKAMMDANPVKTQKIGIICCWNEFGEGSYIEPTKRWEFEYLERVKKVFGSSTK